MAKTLYVGNLPWSATEEELQAAFSRHARVERCRIMTDRETGRSRGFAFVDVADEDVQRAIAGMNGAQFAGRAITVDEARPRQPRSDYRGGGSRY